MEVQGSTTARFGAVREAFAAVLDSTPGTGSGYAVWHHGAWVVDLWGGYADAERTRPWREDTLVMTYSTTKPYAAVCALLLADRGLLDLDAPLTRYWPEMRADTTMRQVLAHQSGHVRLDEPLPTEAFYDWDLLCGQLAEQQPAWPPGTAHGEAALFYGHLVGEVVRRIDGRTLGEFLREEVCEPHGLDFHVGLRPSDLERVADVTGYDDRFRREWEERPVMGRAMANPPGALDPDVVNSERWRTAQIPAINGHGTARGVAGLYVALTQGGLLSLATLEAMTSPAMTGPDQVLGDDRSWGLGVAVDADGFGMGGVGGSFGWWDPGHGCATGFVTGWIGDYERPDRLDDAVLECLAN